MKSLIEGSVVDHPFLGCSLQAALCDADVGLIFTQASLFLQDAVILASPIILV